ncbi:hypothetical protein W823_01060 [Williamsia sp. D3]|nr:hypothetical protein W823_01060 [Williamsia sp. D3]
MTSIMVAGGRGGKRHPTTSVASSLGPFERIGSVRAADVDTVGRQRTMEKVVA